MTQTMKKLNNKLLLRTKINNEEVCGKISRKTIKKGCPKYENDNSNKLKNQLKLNIDEQPDAIKHLKEYCDIDDIEPL